MGYDLSIIYLPKLYLPELSHSGATAQLCCLLNNTTGLSSGSPMWSKTVFLVATYNNRYNDFNIYSNNFFPVQKVDNVCT